jgi:hypothetical protein
MFMYGVQEERGVGSNASMTLVMQGACDYGREGGRHGGGKIACNDRGSRDQREQVKGSKEKRATEGRVMSGEGGAETCCAGVLLWEKAQIDRLSKR